eukprot:gene36558-45085_t
MCFTGYSEININCGCPSPTVAGKGCFGAALMLEPQKGGVKHFVIHARKAILNMNLTPKENRTIPPLNYDTVYRLVQDFPQVDFTLNGGVKSYEEVEEHYKMGVRGVMIGRAAIDEPYYWRHIDSRVFGGKDPGLTRRQILTLYGQYAEEQEAADGIRRRNLLLKPLHNLFHGEIGKKTYAGVLL